MTTHAFPVVAIVLFCSTVFAQISQKDACQKFSGAVVQIDAGGGSSRGTGFLVSPDGWIFTAAHVVINPESSKAYEVIEVTLSDRSIKIATQVLPIEPKMAGRDFAVLKIEGKNLPSLDFGDMPDKLASGSDLTIIGFPFSAIAFHSSGPSVKDKFCLSGTIAYSGSTDVSVPINTSVGPSAVNVNVDVIYFQGPSVKGLSGAPIISRDTGHVVAILTSKLTGISPALDKAGRSIHTLKGTGAELLVGPVGFMETFGDIIDTMDTQLANGLGAGTGIEDPKFALRRILRQRHTNDTKHK
jgi:hypothetical protein